MKNICVFCGSNYGKNSNYKLTAEKLGKLLVQNGISLIFGGAPSGLMKTIADSVFLSGGKLVGVIPKKLADEEGVYPNLTDIYITGTMYEEKQLMEQLSDAFIILPGGIGTLAELTEIMTLNQLVFMKKPYAILNIDGYFDLFMNLLAHMINEGFFKQADLNHLIIETDEEKLLNRILNFKSDEGAAPTGLTNPAVSTNENPETHKL